MRNPSSDIKCLLMPPRDPALVQQTRQKKLSANAVEAQRSSTFGRTSVSGTSMSRPSWDCRHLTREKAMVSLGLARCKGGGCSRRLGTPSSLSCDLPSALMHAHSDYFIGKALWRTDGIVRDPAERQELCCTEHGFSLGPISYAH